MRFMIIGGITETHNEFGEEKRFQNHCLNIGKKLRELGHSLILCSPFRDSADFWVYNGYVNNDIIENSSIDFYFVNTDTVRSELDNLVINEHTCYINMIPNPPPSNNNKESLKYAWLLCQLQALEFCQAIIAIGGKLNGSANMLLLFAESKRKFILPFPFMEGTANQSFYRKQYELKDRLGEAYLFLKDENKYLEVLNYCEKAYDTTSAYEEEELKVFISYSRARPSEADYIENILRRLGLQVFRDESEFGAGHEIPNEIREAIYNANIFVAVWCAEYACSPWCYDEFEIAMDRKETGKMKLWILCIDDTRIVPTRARNLVNYRVRSREEIEGTILKLIKQFSY